MSWEKVEKMEAANMPHFPCGPGPTFASEGKGVGSIWKCDTCGKRWRIRGFMILGIAVWEELIEPTEKV